MLINFKVLKEAPTVDYSTLIREMRAAGNSLNQLATVANSKGWGNEKEIRQAMVINFNFKDSTETITFADLEKSALG
ncbi:MAG: hypothetical protein ACI4VI_01420 [Acutalibacteraceae bacterium]